jgi:phosphoribosylaminoimidazole-succinocarboxamide synthase
MISTSTAAAAVTSTDLPLGPPVRGKVRDCYRFTSPAFGDALLIVSTDRISAFDWILPTPIPDKGKVLTAISRFWFDLLAGGPAPIAHHLHTTDVDAMGLPAGVDLAPLRGRTMLVKRAEVVPFECVVRGWLAGSGLAEYRRSGTVCGVPLPAGLAPGARLPAPIFTPATKAASGHDENVSFDVMAAAIGADLAAALRDRSLEVYRRGAEHAAARGIVLADTKFEWGRLPDGSLILVDEVLTPDSSRFWPAADAGQGRVPDSFDKQFVRDWLESSGWDKASPPPELPADVVAKTRDKYLEACRLLTGLAPENAA